MSGFVRFDEGLNMDAQINTFGNWEESIKIIPLQLEYRAAGELEGKIPPGGGKCQRS